MAARSRRARHQLAVDELDLGLCDRGKRELPRAHRDRLFPKPPMPGHVKPRLGRQEPLEAAGPQDPNNGVFGPEGGGRSRPQRRRTRVPAGSPWQRAPEMDRGRDMARKSLRSRDVDVDTFATLTGRATLCGDCTDAVARSRSAGAGLRALGETMGARSGGGLRLLCAVPAYLR